MKNGGRWLLISFVRIPPSRRRFFPGTSDSPGLMPSLPELAYPEAGPGQSVMFIWLAHRKKRKGRVGNWRSGLGLAYPHFHEDVSVSVSFGGKARGQIF